MVNGSEKEMKCYTCKKIIYKDSDCYEDDDCNLYCCSACYCEVNAKSVVYAGDDEE